MTRAPIASASFTRAFQACSLRDARPISITMFLAAFSSAAACATCSAAGALATGGVKRATSSGASGSESFASCISASRLT